jgi:hypothetical protein
MGRERKASQSLLLASCMDDAMVELVELGSGSTQARVRRKVKRRPQEEWEEQGDAHGQSGVPFYRPGSRDVPLACLLASNGIAVVGCLDGAARSE